MSDYSIWIVECGHALRFPVSGIYYGSHNAGTMEVPFCYVVLKGEGHVALVDTGYRYVAYGREIADTFGVTDWRDPSTALGDVGLAPEDVDAVFVTHCHWDHMGHLDAFPNATIYLQAAELNRWMWALAQPRRMAWLRIGVDPADFHHLFERSVAGQVRLLDGSTLDVLPGIDVGLALDTHTHGHQYVVVHTSDGPYVATGDCVYTVENLTGLDGSGTYVPIGYALCSQTRVLEVYDDVMGIMGGDPARILPAHDPGTWARHPSREVAPGLALAEVHLAAGERSRLEAPA